MRIDKLVPSAVRSRGKKRWVPVGNEPCHEIGCVLYVWIEVSPN